MITRLFLICALCLSVVPASADDSAQANKLLVEAVTLIQAANTKQTPAEKMSLLKDALAKLNKIVQNHPSSDLAVKLITGQQIGNISLSTLSEAIESLEFQATQADAAATRNACLESLNAKDPKCEIWLSDIVRAHLQARNTKDAFDAAMTAPPGLGRDNLLHEIVRSEAQAGNVKAAMAAIESMATERIRDIALYEVDEGQARIVLRHLQEGNLADALAMANSIQTPQLRDVALQDIVEAQVRGGSIQDALATAKSIEGRRRQQSALRNVAATQIQVANQHLQAGDLQSTLKAAEQIPDASARNQFFAAVANTQLHSENFKDALTTAQRIEDPSAPDPLSANMTETPGPL